MRNITHCPSCHTEFFVSDEQLAMHHGKVRCGQCMTVFNANEHMVGAQKPQESLPFSYALPPDGVLNSTPNASQPSTTPMLATGTATTNTANVGTSATHTPSRAVEKNAAISVTSYMASEDAKDNLKAHEQQAQRAAEMAQFNVSESDRPSYLDAMLDSNAPEPIEMSAASRWLWRVLAFLLLLGAIAQVVYYKRNEVSVMYPQVKPYLAQVCVYAQCSIDLPQQIEAIVIDDSDIQEDADYEGVMHLSSTLISKARTHVAYPKLELTLTDMEDQPKLRKSFLPEEYLPEEANIAEGLAPGAEIKIKMAITASHEKVAGYRVFVRY